MQKRIITAIIILFASFTACAAQHNEDAIKWKETVSVEGRFKLTFPGEPVTRVRDAENPAGKIRVTQISVSFPQISYMLTWADFPPSPDTSEKGLRVNYDALRDGMIEKAGARLYSERDVRTNGKLGRELFVSIGTQLAKYRLYVVNGRQYQVITSRDVALKSDLDSQQRVDRFLDSFQIIEK